MYRASTLHLFPTPCRKRCVKIDRNPCLTLFCTAGLFRYSASPVVVHCRQRSSKRATALLVSVVHIKPRSFKLSIGVVWPFMLCSTSRIRRVDIPWTTLRRLTPVPVLVRIRHREIVGSCHTACPVFLGERYSLDSHSCTDRLPFIRAPPSLPVLLYNTIWYSLYGRVSFATGSYLRDARDLPVCVVKQAVYGWVHV